MAEYIDRNLIEWYGCDFEDGSCEHKECLECSQAECSHTQVMQIPTVNAILIPDGATNGDMIKVMFPNAKYFKGVNHCNRDEDGNPKQCMYMSIIGVIYHPFPIDWWNAPYNYNKEVEE